MKNNITELVFIIDKSGSMYELKADTVGGFNATIEKQRAEEGRAFISTVLFDNASHVIHDRVDIGEVKPMTLADYTPSGCTALLDALGDAMKHIGNIHKYARPDDVPEHTVFVITTDGMENASSRYTAEEIKSEISRRSESDGWEFIFLAANINAVEAAGNIGIRPERAANYRHTGEGVERSYAVMSEAISNIRCCRVPECGLQEMLDGTEEQ